MSQAPIRLVDAGWEQELTSAIRAYPSEVRIVCPFIKKVHLNVCYRMGPVTFK